MRNNMEEPNKQDNSGRDDKGRFKPGTSGNPAGKPKFSLITILKEELNKYQGDDDKDTVARELILKYLEKARRGDPILLKDVFNRIDGMPKQNIGFGDDEDNSYEVDIKIRKNEKE